ncbi:hypothetical protein GCM10022261_10720 [Brevibacterium daeguense]|uniref:Peptidoglycan-binding protein n=1 Tax=Brevibacterium daeguense TaxID=909936 RepID=A0ABP8EHV7_9MICO|nr:peptidoglycan-binding protein [Brevibacterium daeguense]
MPRRSAKRSGPVAGSVLGLALTAGLLGVVLVVVWAANALSGIAPASIRQLELSGVDRLDDAQLHNARTIIAIGRGADMPDSAVVIALMTALQESSLRNLDYGDRDSLGLFQQRPSQGWGSPEQVTDPIWAAKSFYGVNPDGVNPGLRQISGWQRMTPTEAAQAVQRSAYPNAYAKWQDLAEELIRTQTAITPIS